MMVILKREGLVNTSNSRWAQEPDKQISKSVTCIGESVNSHLSEETNFTKTTELASWTHGLMDAYSCSSSSSSSSGSSSSSSCCCCWLLVVGSNFAMLLF